MTNKLTLSIFSCLLFLSFSCKRENKESSDYNKTINNYQELINYAEKNEQDQLQNKMKELGADDKFHLQKLAKNQKENSIIIQTTGLIESGRYDEAATILQNHIKKNGLSPALEELRLALNTLQNFKLQRSKAERGELSKDELSRLQEELIEVFPASKKLNTTKMNAWFQKQHQLIRAKAATKINRLFTISLIQLDQINTELDLKSKAGAEIYFRELSQRNKPSQSHTTLQRSIISFHSAQTSSPASVSEAVLQLYKRSSKQALVNTVIELNKLDKDTQIAQSLKDRILRSTLSTKNIELEKISKSPLLNLPTLMEIIIKSEE